MKIAVCVDIDLYERDTNLSTIKILMEEPNKNITTKIDSASVSAIELGNMFAKDKSDITIITYGGKNNQLALEYALAYGLKNVVHLTENDEDLSLLYEPQNIAQKIANWLEKESFDLIICGQSSDSEVIPSIISAHLEIPIISRITNINNISGNTFEIEQQLEKGWTQIIEFEPPAVLTIQNGVIDTKYVSVKKIKNIEKKVHQINVVELKNEKILNTQQIKAITTPRARAKRTVVADASVSAADRLQSLFGGAAIGGAGFSEGGFGGAVFGDTQTTNSKNDLDNQKTLIKASPKKCAQEIINFLEENELLPESLI